MSEWLGECSRCKVRYLVSGAPSWYSVDCNACYPHAHTVRLVIE